MPNAELVRYVAEARAQGVPDAQIRVALLSAGWRIEDVDSALAGNIPGTSQVPIAPAVPSYAASLAPVTNMNPQIASPAVSSGGPAPKSSKAKLFIFSALILVLLGGGLTFAYIKELGPFSRTLSDEKLFAGLPDALSRIDTESYALSVMIASKPREPGAKPLEKITFPAYEEYKEAYKRDVKKVNGITGILSTLELYKSKNINDLYPAALPTSTNYGFTRGTIDPQTFHYTSDGQTFALGITLETRDALDQVREYYKQREEQQARYKSSYMKTSLPPTVEGKTVTFRNGALNGPYLLGTPKSSFLLSYLDSLDEAFNYLPMTLDIKFRADGAADFRSQKTTDGKFGIGADVDLGDMSFSASIDFMKQSDAFYLRVNKFPGLGFFDLTPIKNKWVKITSSDLKSSSGGFSFFFDPSSIEKFTSSTIGRNQKTIEQGKLLYAIAIRDNVLKATQQAPLANDPKNSRHFSITINKENVAKFYKDAVLEFGKRYGEESPMAMDDMTLAFIESPAFDGYFEYLKAYSSFDMWVDKTEGFPVKLVYASRIVPGDKAEKLKNTEYSVVTSLDLTDINQPITLEAPKDAISFAEAGRLVSGKSPEDFDDLQHESRDSERISDISTLKSAIGLYLADVDKPALCTKGKIYRSFDGTDAVDGTGWLPVNFESISSGSPIGNLPVDPGNDARYYYSYACDPATLTFELNAVMESDKYGGSGTEWGTDGGDNPDVYEAGTNLKLLPIISVAKSPSLELSNQPSGIQDARRGNDLKQVQTMLELYYSKIGKYPAPGANWAALSTTLTGAGIGVSQVPKDASDSKSYKYCTDTNGYGYVLAATFDNASYSSLKQDLDGTFVSYIPGAQCTADANAPKSCDDPVYCVQL
ncbi:MAG: hypothetical protein Q7S28_02045 [bacterium]|nr:hypothetical protein [bacterium]